MNFLRISLIVVFFLVFLGPASVYAQSHNHESHHQVKLVSPFEGAKKHISLHCLLKLHKQHGFCPHSRHKTDASISLKISSDCGGGDSGALLDTVSFGQDFTEAHPLLLMVNYLKLAFISDYFFGYHLFNDSLSPPPRII